jgi:aspartate--ammonia ligase
MFAPESLAKEKAIQLVKESFSSELEKSLKLHKVSSPLIVLSGTGLNDDLNGIERAVKFPIKALNERMGEVVHSLAKWKRVRLKEFDIPQQEGIITDMKALRPDEDFTPIHSIYVDQWDWELHIAKTERNIAKLKEVVEKIYQVFKNTEATICQAYPEIKPILPEKISFIFAEDLAKQYPTLTDKQKESKVTKEFGAVFLMGIGGMLSTGEAHDGRAPDYDDWSSPNEEGHFGLNGDILLWNPILESSFEVSSMGIRVDEAAMTRQLEIRNCPERAELNFHKELLAGNLPQSLGGGIGQSRVVMFMLRQKHIKDVQVSIWGE